MSDSKYPPTSTEKKTRARIVFGDVVTDDETESLSYSPSPSKDQTNQANEKSIALPDLSKLLCDNLDQTEQSCRTGSKKPDETSKENRSEGAHQAKTTLSTKTLARTNAAKENASKSSFRAKKLQDIKDRARVPGGGQIAQAKALSAKVQQERLRAIQLERQLSSRLAQQRAKKEAIERQNHSKNICNELQFKSQVHCKHVQLLREQEEARRRASVDVRAAMRQNHRAGKQKLKEDQRREDLAIFDERHAMSEAIRSAKMENATARRKSYIFRAGDARRIRQIHMKQEADRLRQEQQDFKLKRAGDKDSDSYHSELNDKRRKSLAQRNERARAQRKEAASSRLEELNDEHMSYLLKWEGENDSKEYLKKVERMRRQSLVGRRAESMRHAKTMSELKAIVQEQEIELYAAKRAGDKDVEEYMKIVAAERRSSLQKRGKETLHHRKIEQLERSKEVSELHEDETLRAADQRAKEEYRKTCAARDRHSLQFRGTEARIQRLIEEEHKVEHLERRQESFHLNTQDRQNAAEYIAECKRRRRLSLAFRAKERQRSSKWKRQQHLKDVSETNSLVHDQLMDRQYEQLAKEQERKEKALLLLRRLKPPYHEN